ncbi:MAG TPA: hypothetical protein PKC18_12660 [Lacipirellulaceae bacterium]|nr:hypothetical protein [Lacipirellulaceae bacterium]
MASFAGRFRCRWLGGALVLLIAVPAWGQEGSPDEEAADASPELIAALEQSLSGATLAGNFTVAGEDGARPRQERYELGEVKHLGGNRWLIAARIKYGDHDVTLPLTLPIRWAGDTPVITVDDIGFPGLGTYSARVMIYRDHYSGYWTGKDHGGHLFGRLERGDEDGSKDVAE